MTPLTCISTLTLAAYSLLGSGCLSVPTAQGVASTGEPLAISAKNIVQERAEAHRVGTAATENGGTIDIYRIDTHRDVVDVDWTLRQGRLPIDDEDFFRIAGDQEALAAVESHRSAARWWSRGATVALAAGLVMSLAGSKNSESSAGKALAGGGLVLDIVGGYGLLYAIYNMSGSRAHGVSLRRTIDAANSYNATLPAR